MYIHEYNLDVRYYETDLMGIVHHSNYIRYFECGRNDALVSMGLPIKQIELKGIMMPVVSVSCNYKSPAYQGDTLRVVSIIKDIPKVKMIIENEIYNQDNVLVCTGTVVLGFIHSDSRKATRAPAFIVDLFKPFFTNN
jgi:acyl-CoA thioester hydrolase